MKLFKIPFDIKHEEKIFGGYLSLRQVIYLMLAATSSIILTIRIHIAIKVTIITLITIFLLLCSFLKINGQYFDKLFFYAVKYMVRKKIFLYARCNK